MIIEDEYILGRRLEKIVAEIRPEYKMVARTAGVEESVKTLKDIKDDIDLIFMDIELSDGNCFEIFENIEILLPIIFTTAYDEYAISAFKVNSIDYLLKPIGKDALDRALNKFERFFANGLQLPDYANLKEKIEEEAAKDRILIEQGNRFIPIRISEIAYFISEGRYTNIKTFSGMNYLIDKALYTLDQELPNKIFFRMSRNCIININAVASVQRFSNGRLKVIANPASESEIIVSHARREEFLKWMGWGKDCVIMPQ